MLLNFNVFTKLLKDIDLKSVRIINTINPHSYCVTKKDKAFEQALRASDLLLPDGVGIVWAEKLLNKNRIQKIAGFDVFMFFMNDMNANKGSVFFLGASQSTLKSIQEKAKIEFPNVNVHSYSPPYKSEFCESDSSNMCNIVNKANPDVLFVGMTAPKQEKWVHKNEYRLETKTICSIGAVFDFYAGNIKRPSDFWISIGLEWLPRFLKEPRRLAQRNLISTPKFILEVLCFKILKKGLL